ncbi:MAG: NmrA family NAD(P)-binding protein [Acetobacteraceae bacterium]|nr:NmrA family NAD(P)-binding protein [Acetobacteraceae bacterium]
MTILVTGSTGTIGSLVVSQLADRGAEVRAMVRDPAKAELPAGVAPVRADFLDVDAMRAALRGASTLFLLNAVVPDELTQALIALDLAREAGIERVVYFSVLTADISADVPHFASERAVERMIEQADVPATVLRPAYFFQNDAALQEPVLGRGVYPMPVGGVGVEMADARDIAEVAALSILKRETAAGPLPRELIEIAGPDALTGDALAALWSDLSGKQVAYAGDDLDAFEEQTKARMPGWAARDMRLMVRGFQRHGMKAKPDAQARLTEVLGRPPRAYRDFARETLERWRRV